MLGFTQDDRFLYFVLEYVQGGELFTYLRNKGKLDNPEALFYGAQVYGFNYLKDAISSWINNRNIFENQKSVSMFEYLHGKNIVYRDLKPENILIG